VLYVKGRLKAIEGIKLASPAGAFYVFPDVSGLVGDGCHAKGFGPVLDADELCRYLLEVAQVALVPGRDLFPHPSILLYPEPRADPNSYADHSFVPLFLSRTLPRLDIDQLFRFDLDQVGSRLLPDHSFHCILCEVISGLVYSRRPRLSPILTHDRFLTTLPCDYPQLAASTARFRV
jgi:hypothetical protein